MQKNPERWWIVMDSGNAVFRDAGLMVAEVEKEEVFIVEQMKEVGFLEASEKGQI